MNKPHIIIEDMTARGIDLLLHTTLCNQEPEIRITNAGKKEYIVKRTKNKYVSLKTRKNGMSQEEAPLPYYSSNNREAIQLCEKYAISWSVNYVSTSSLYLASVNDVNYVYKTAAGALARAVLIHELKRKFGNNIVITYKVLDKFIEL